MNKFQKWLFQWLLNVLLNNGDGHSGKHTRELYKMIRNHSLRIYYEDNIPTVDSFLQEKFDEARGKP